MTKNEFSAEFDRLCTGFEYKARATQAEAFFERLQHCHAADWHEAVTDLLCAPMFPKTLDVILDAVEKRAEQRRRRRVHDDNAQAHRTMSGIVQDGILSMKEALSERPDLAERLKKLFTS